MKLGVNLHGNVDYDEAQMVEKIALEDPAVLAEIKKLELPEGTVVCADPWIYGKYEAELAGEKIGRLISPRN